MKTKTKKVSDTRVELTVTLEAKDLQPFTKAALEKLSKEIKVEGFRKGKVPVDVAKKFIPENDLNSEVVDQAVRATVIPAFQKSESSPLVLPTVNVTKYVPGELIEYTAEAEIVPEIKLGDYKNLGVKKPTIKITAKQVDEVLDNIARSYAEKKATKKAAENEDEVIIDFVGKKDGEAFQGGSSKDYPLVLGSGSFIPGFEEGIVGHEPGDKFELDLTFPKDYGVTDLAGAKTTFEILLKQVNEVKKPKIDDELAKKVGPFEDLKSLKADIKKNLELQEEARAKEQFKDELIKALIKKSKVPVPEILVEDQLRVLKDDVTRNAQSRGLSFEDFLKQAGETEESWEKQAREIAEERVKASLVLQTLAVERKVSVSDDEVAAKIAELKDVYQRSPEALKNLKDPNVKTDIRNRLIIEKTLDLLVKENS